MTAIFDVALEEMPLSNSQPIHCVSLGPLPYQGHNSTLTWPLGLLMLWHLKLEELRFSIRGSSTKYYKVWLLPQYLSLSQSPWVKPPVPTHLLLISLPIYCMYFCIILPVSNIIITLMCYYCYCYCFCSLLVITAMVIHWWHSTCFFQISAVFSLVVNVCSWKC